RGPRPTISPWPGSPSATAPSRAGCNCSARPRRTSWRRNGSNTPRRRPCCSASSPAQDRSTRTATASPMPCSVFCTGSASPRRSVADALVSAYLASGGTLMLNAEAGEILIQDGSTRGVRLRDGRRLEADVVIATCDPVSAARLATPGGLDRTTRTRLEYAPAHRANVGPSLINVASSRPFRLKRHQDLRKDGVDLNQAVGLIGGADELRRALVQARRGQVPAAPVFSVSPMTNWDPSMAPEGQGVAYLYLPVFPVDVNAGWATAKPAAAQAVVARAADYYDGFDAELG